MDEKRNNSFYKRLFRKIAPPIFTIFGVGLLYIFFMSIVDHRSFPLPAIVLFLAITKTVVITSTTLKQLSKMIKKCHSLERLLWVFGLLIGISIFSFATDYTCLYQFEQSNFEGIPTYPNTYVYNLYHFFYFSVITFSTVGYGDIIPVSGTARFIVMLEMFLSFFIIVFALANVKKIHLK